MAQEITNASKGPRILLTTEGGKIHFAAGETKVIDGELDDKHPVQKAYIADGLLTVSKAKAAAKPKADAKAE